MPKFKEQPPELLRERARLQQRLDEIDGEIERSGATALPQELGKTGVLVEPLLFQEVFDQSIDVLFILEAETGTILAANQGVRRVFGYEKAEMVGQPFVILLPPASPTETSASSQKFHIKDAAIVSQDFRRRDGTLCTMDLTAMVIQHLGRKLIVASLRESEERKLAELAMETRVEDADNRVQQAYENLRGVIEATDDIILLLDQQGRLLMTNHVWPALIGHSPEELLNKTTFDFLPEENRQPRREHLQEAFATGKPIRFNDSSGGKFWQNSICPIRGKNGSVTRCVIFVHDITDFHESEEAMSRNLEREMQLNEMKTRFISTASHEFRTPIAAARMALDILTNHFDRLTGEKRQEQLGRIDRALIRVTEMLENVLTANRIESKKIVFNPVTTDLNALARKAIEDARVADSLHHVFELLEIPGGGGVVRADPLLLQPILMNLLGNAVRYSPAGSQVVVKLAIDQSEVSVSVTDQGIGIPESDYPRVFQVFERGSNTGTIRGSGLGLNIVKRMIELHGGEISFTSKVGAGTCFVFRIPIERIS